MATVSYAGVVSLVACSLADVKQLSADIPDSSVL